MPTKREVAIDAINAALNEVAKKTPVAFSIGDTHIKIDERGISIVLTDEVLDQFVLRIHRPNIDVSCWGYVLVAEPGVVMSGAAQSEWTGFHVVGCIPKIA